MSTINTETYSIYRGWADGESMCQHLIQGGFPSVEEAIDHSRLGGYVVRESDGCSLAPGLKNGEYEWLEGR